MTSPWNSSLLPKVNVCSLWHLNRWFLGFHVSAAGREVQHANAYHAEDRKAIVTLTK
jgi:hypothetical protein